MTKEKALKKTKNKFTNLIDNCIKSGTSVHSIISYYEDLIADKKPSYKAPVSGIEANFLEEKIQDDEFYLRNGYSR
jgi:hypothetical protein